MEDEKTKPSTRSKGYEMEDSGFKVKYLFSSISTDRYNIAPFITLDGTTRMFVQAVDGDGHIFDMAEFEKAIDGIFNNRQQ